MQNVQIEICCGLTEEDFEKTSDRCKDKAASFDFPQIHEDFSDTRLFLELKKCMETCGIYDFGWKDLACPTPKRFRCQLSAAINMAKFREDQLKLYAELNEPVSSVLDFFCQLMCGCVFLTSPGTIHHDSAWKC